MEDDQRDVRVSFGDFQADLASGELFRRGKSIAIQRKPFRILTLLLNSRGALVCREQIVKHVWPDVHVDHQHCLNTAIRKLRTALGDDATEPTLIETVGSRGYRLLVPVVFPSAEVLQNSSSDVTLAVLPFKNFSGAEDAFFSDGLTEQMIAQLGRTCRDLSVIAPITSMHYRDTSKEALQVGRELMSDYLLCGSVLKGNQRFRITARLIRTCDQVCLWSDSYARNDADIFLVQDEITQQIARAIARTLRLSNAENVNLTTRPSVYENFLKAAFYLNKGDEVAFVKAVEFYEKVITEDPNFAPGYTSLAVLLITAGQYGVMPPSVVYERVEELNAKATLLSPTFPETNVCIGFAKFFYHADFAAAESAFLRALELNQSCSPAYQGYGMLLSAMGRFDESVAAMRHLCQLDPFSPMANALLSTSLCMAGRLQEGLSHAKYTLELEPNFPTAHACVGWSLSGMGNYEDGISAFRTAVKCSPQSSLMLAHLAHGLAVTRHVDESREILQSLLALRDKGIWVSPYWISLINIALGDLNAAHEWFEVAVNERDGWRVFARSDERFSPAAADPRFGPLLAQIGSPDATKTASAGTSRTS